LSCDLFDVNFQIEAFNEAVIVEQRPLQGTGHCAGSGGSAAGKRTKTQHNHKLVNKVNKGEEPAGAVEP